MQQYNRNDKQHDDERVTLGDNDSMTTTSSGQLAHLHDLDDFKIADGEPDIRGWDVRTTDGQKVGKVEDLLVDTAALKVRYIEVQLEKDISRDIDMAAASGQRRDNLEAATARRVNAASGGEIDARERRYVLVPIGVARLDKDEDDVLLDTQAAQLAGIPDYARAGVTRDYERDVLRGYGATAAAVDGIAPSLPLADRGQSSSDRFYEGQSFDDHSFFGERRKGKDDSYVRRADDAQDAEHGGIRQRAVDNGRDVDRRNPKERDRDMMESPSDLDSSIRDQINPR